MEKFYNVINAETAIERAAAVVEASAEKAEALLGKAQLLLLWWDFFDLVCVAGNGPSGIESVASRDSSVGRAADS